MLIQPEFTSSKFGLSDRQVYTKILRFSVITTLIQVYVGISNIQYVFFKGMRFSYWGWFTNPNKLVLTAGLHLSTYIFLETRSEAVFTN